MKRPNGNSSFGSNGNGSVPPRSVSRTPESPTIERPVVNRTPLRVTVIADHEMEVHLRSLEAMLAQNHPEMAAFLRSHAAEMRSVMTAALDGAIQSERRRLTWLLHNDLSELLSAARERLVAVSDATSEESTRDALRGVDVCLSAAAKATRGLISDLGPGAPQTKKE